MNKLQINISVVYINSFGHSFGARDNTEEEPFGTEDKIQIQNVFVVLIVL